MLHLVSLLADTTDIIWESSRKFSAKGGLSWARHNSGWRGDEDSFRKEGFRDRTVGLL